MSPTCVLTDSTAQFPVPAFPGRDRVYSIPLHLHANGMRYEKSEGLRAADLPASADAALDPRVQPPSLDEFQAMFAHLSQFYSDVLVIVHSAYLTKTFLHAQAAAGAFPGPARVQVVDAGTTATGLGLVVQAAAAAAEENRPAEEIENMVRAMLPRVYSLFCIPGLTYMHRAGHLGLAQALVGEHLDVLPLYVLDHDQFMPTQKARNGRALVDLLHEFILEFENLEHIALLQGVPPFDSETRALRERINEDYGPVAMSEHIINPALAALFGPHSLGVFVLQGE
ncbi:MAG: DegV family EDD domain-containing protein [Anaerolineae bacterium]|nr:MAG: DegV family EDD domain-containing protein [Anaerolineae bacterium]